MCTRKLRPEVPMDQKVVSLSSVDATPGPNGLVIERIKQLLESAESGELQGFLIVGETYEGNLYEGGSEINDLPLIMLGVKLAEARLTQAALEIV